MSRAPPRLTVIGAAGLPLRADKTGQPLRTFSIDRMKKKLIFK